MFTIQLRYGRAHVSWFLTVVAAGILAGTALAPFAPIGLYGYGWLIVVAALLLVVLSKRLVWMLTLALLAGGLLGMWRGGLLQQNLVNYRPFYDRQVSLEGLVSNDPEYGPRGEQRFRVNGIEIASRQLPGVIYASSHSITDIKRGDKVVLNGKLREGFGNFQGGMYFATIERAERPNPGDVARELRDTFAAGIRNAVPEPEASLGVGYLVGQRSALPESLDEQLRLVGLTHVVVASGYNLTILIRFARRFFARYSRFMAFSVASSLMGAFVLVTGFSPSMSRAALVTGLSLAAWYYGRRVHPVTLLLVAAAVTILVNPLYIWGDIGWYLSFTAFAGVVLLAPLLQHLLFGIKQKTGAIKQVLVETTSAQLLTMPIIMFIFGTYSVLALPANLLVLPLVPVAMALSAVAGVAGVLAPSVAGWFGVPANFILQYMTSVVEFLAALPWAEGQVRLKVAGLIVSYIAIAVLMFALWRKTKHNFAGDSVVE